MSGNRKGVNEMACPGLDPRGGTTCGQCLGNKMTSYVLGYLQTVIWILGFIGIMSDPGTARAVEIALGIVIGMLMLVFAVLLLIGLHRDRRSYIKAYLIFCAVITILLILSFFITLFTHPSKITFKAFVGNFILICLNILSFLAVRAFYLATYS